MNDYTWSLCKDMHICGAVRVFKCLQFTCKCAHLCVFVCAFSSFTCVHAPRGETGCVGCYLPLQRVTANRQPWQTLGERGGKREGEEMALGRGIGIWIPLSNHRALRILSSQPRFEFRPELDNRAASHLPHWQLIYPHKYRYILRQEAAAKTLRQFLMTWINLRVCRSCQQQLWSPTCCS